MLHKTLVYLDKHANNADLKERQNKKKQITKINFQSSQY
jgi:hypothetical protein